VLQFFLEFFLSRLKLFLIVFLVFEFFFAFFNFLFLLLNDRACCLSLKLQLFIEVLNLSFYKFWICNIRCHSTHWLRSWSQWKAWSLSMTIRIIELLGLQLFLQMSQLHLSLSNCVLKHHDLLLSFSLVLIIFTLSKEFWLWEVEELLMTLTKLLFDLCYLSSHTFVFDFDRSEVIYFVVSVETIRFQRLWLNWKSVWFLHQNHIPHSLDSSS